MIFQRIQIGQVYPKCCPEQDELEDNRVLASGMIWSNVAAEEAYRF